MSLTPVNNNNKFKIMIDARILEGNIRGMGYFLKQIIEELSVLDKKNEYILFVNNKNKIKINLNIGNNFSFCECNMPIGFTDIVVIPVIANFLIKPDIIWFPANNCSPFLSKKIKIVSTIHDIMFFTQKYKVFTKQYFGSLYRKMFSTIAVKRADLINTRTLYNIKLFSNFFKTDEHKFFYFYTNGANLTNDPDDSILHRLNIQKNSYLYTISGTSPNKNIEFTISAFKKFNKIVDKKYKLVVTGAYLKNRSDFNIIFTNYITDREKNSLLANCKLFLFLSRDEGFGVPPIEAIYNNCNILLSNISNLVELYSGYAHFVDIENETDVAKKMLDIINKKIDYNKEKIIEKFSYQKGAKEMQNKMISLMEK